MTTDTLYNRSPSTGFWDEMHDGESVRAHYTSLQNALSKLSEDDLLQKHKQAAELFMRRGITFTVYFDNEGIERIFPFDIIPRLIAGEEWRHIESGIKQRLKALNLFLKDIYS